MKLICFIFTFVSLAYSFVPPVGMMLKDIYDDRRSYSGVEAVIRHQIKTASGVVEIEEQMLGAKNFAYCVFKSEEGSALFSRWEKGGYVFPGERRVSARTSLLNKVFTAFSGEEYRDALLSEGFLKREQLQQYQAEFDPQGDPATWDIQQNYLFHPDVYWKRVGTNVGIAAEGEEGKRFVLDSKNEGVRELAWGDTSWILDGFVGEPKCPRSLIFQKAKENWVVSQVISCRYLKAKPYQDLIKSVKMKASLKNSFNHEEAINILLSYR